MLPNREGRFKATILEHGVAETGPNSLATFVCRFQLVQELISGQWEPVEEDFDITGYFYLEKRDGSLNTVIIDQLKKAFGWDGRDPFWLQDTDFSGLQVQIKLGWERWNNQDRLKVQWIDAEDATPLGVPQADENVRRSIASRLGAKLRANAGGTPAPAPRPGGNGPTQPPKPAPGPASRPAAPPAGGATMQQAWEAFVKAQPQGSSQEQLEREWFRILGEMFPGRQPEQLTPQQWQRFIDRQTADDEVPF